MTDTMAVVSDSGKLFQGCRFDSYIQTYDEYFLFFLLAESSWIIYLNAYFCVRISFWGSGSRSTEIVSLELGNSVRLVSEYYLLIN